MSEEHLHLPVAVPVRGEGRGSDWVRTAIGAAAGSYLLVFAFGAAQAEKPFAAKLQEAAALIVLSGAWITCRRRPRAAAIVVLATVLAEVTLSTLEREPVMSCFMGVFPVLVFAAGLMLGRRAAMWMASASAVLLPSALYANGSWGPHFEHFSVYADGNALLIGELSIGVTACLTWAGLKAVAIAHAESEQARRRYTDLFEQAPDGLVVVDEQGRVSEANRVAQQILGAGLESLRGRAFTDLWRSAGGSKPLELGLKPSAALTLADLTTPEGALRRFEISVRPGDDAAHGALLSIRDVSERRLMEERLDHAQRLESVGRLAGGLAHDFNNLLTIIGGNAMLLALHPDEEVRAQATEIVGAEKRGSNLTRQLLAFARRDLHRPQVINLGRAVAGLARLVERLIGEQCRLSLRREEGVRILADLSQIEQVVLNLAANARDAMPDGGVVEISVRLLLRKEAEELGSTLAAGPQALLEVADAGVGMSPELKARIFEPFFTTKPRGQGTGLGLASVHGIIAQSGGAIHVDTAPGKGTRFRIFFPQSVEPEEDDGPRSAAAAPAPRARRHVLLVEDEEHVRALGVRILTRAGYRVTEAAGAVEALETLRRVRAVDALVTDVVMPGPSGIELVRLLRPEFPDLPVLFVSGHFEDGVLDDPEIDARRNLLAKPFSPDLLVEKVTHLLGGPNGGNRGAGSGGDS